LLRILHLIHCGNKDLPQLEYWNVGIVEGWVVGLWNNLIKEKRIE
jgi:hypothetical protein